MRSNSANADTMTYRLGARMKRTTRTETAVGTTVAALLCAGWLHLPLDTAAAAAAAPDVVAVALVAGDTLFPHQGNGGYDVNHYDLAITFARDGSIQATATIDATATADAPLSEFSLDLEGLTVSAVTINDVAATHLSLIHI